MKEARAATSLALKKIKCPSCFALTGTLIQNRMDEMWSVLDFVCRTIASRLEYLAEQTTRLIVVTLALLRNGENSL